MAGGLEQKGEKQNVTQASQEIPHPTTGWAQVGLIAEIGRDRMWSDCYERSMGDLDLVVSHILHPEISSCRACSDDVSGSRKAQCPTHPVPPKHTVQGTCARVSSGRGDDSILNHTI